MKIDGRKLDLALARQCKSLHDLRTDLSPTTLVKARNGGELTPKTVGRLAQLLGADPAELLKEEA